MLCIGAKIQSEMGAATVARYAAGRIFRLEDESLLIDPLGEAGAKGPSAGGSIEFSRVKFAYPQRPHAQARFSGFAERAITGKFITYVCCTSGSSSLR